MTIELDPAAKPVALGLHVGPEQMAVAIVEGQQLSHLDDHDLSRQGKNVFWFRPTPSSLEYFMAADLQGVDLEGDGAHQTVCRTLEEVVGEIDRRGLTARQCVLSLPSACDESARRQWLAHLAGVFPAVGLIDSTSAVLRALGGQLNDGLTVAVAVTEERTLELALVTVNGGAFEISAIHSLEEFSGRALNHFLLQSLLDRLPADGQGRVMQATESDLTWILTRLNKSRSMLGKMKEFRFEVFPPPLEVTAPLRQQDIKRFFADRRKAFAGAVEDLRQQAGLRKSVDRVLLVSDWAAFADFTEMLEELLGPIEPSPLALVAEGAAIAAGSTPLPPRDLQRPAPIALATFLSQNARPLVVAPPAGRYAVAEAAIQRMFAGVEDLLSEEKTDQTRDLLLRVKNWADRLLADWEPSRRTPPAPQGQVTLPGGSAADQQPLEEPPAAGDLTLSLAASRSRRLLADAERRLRAGMALEAVRLSHLAHKHAEEDHEVLMAMLDLHRRAAATLAGPQNFGQALIQLRCALEHRPNDEATQKALAERLIEQARYHESRRECDLAVRLLEEALDLVDDDSAIVEQLDRLRDGGDP